MARIGFLPEHFRFQPWLKAGELLHLHGRLHGMGAAERRRRTPELLARVGLEGQEETRLGAFSKGMSQRIGLAQALLNDPELVVLDEPTSGLDPLGRRHVMELIRGLRAAGTTVFLNSHLLSEVEATCDRVAVLKHGRVARSGTLDELSGADIDVEIEADGWTPELLERLARLGRLGRRDGARVTLTIADRSALPEIAAALVAGGARLYGMVPRRPSLEELFVRIIEGPAESGA
jgi:ABC-2 type transport system ATP-binding protein